MDKKIKSLDQQIVELQKKREILMLEKQIEEIKNQRITIVDRIVYRDIIVPQVIQQPWYPQYPYPSINCQAGPTNAMLTAMNAGGNQYNVA